MTIQIGCRALEALDGIMIHMVSMTLQYDGLDAIGLGLSGQPVQ